MDAIHIYLPGSDGSRVLTGDPCTSVNQLTPLLIICYFGAIGNFATMMVMLPHATKRSTALILCVLAVFDTGALFTNTLDCFTQVAIKFLIDYAFCIAIVGIFVLICCYCYCSHSTVAVVVVNVDVFPVIVVIVFDDFIIAVALVVTVFGHRAR